MLLFYEAKDVRLVSHKKYQKDSTTKVAISQSIFVKGHDLQRLVVYSVGITFNDWRSMLCVDFQASTKHSYIQEIHFFLPGEAIMKA